MHLSVNIKSDSCVGDHLMLFPGRPRGHDIDHRSGRLVTGRLEKVASVILQRNHTTR